MSNRAAMIVIFILAFLVFCCICLVAVSGFLFYRAANSPDLQTAVVPVFDTATPTVAPIVVRTPLPPESQDTLQLLLDATVPGRDLHDLAKRLKGVENAPVVVSESPASHKIGDEVVFNASNEDTHDHFTVAAVLRYETPHVYAFVEKGKSFNKSDLKGLVDTFEDKTYPKDREFFGSEWSPGVDSDEHLYMLFAGNLGFSIAGYFSGADEVSHLVHEYSNEKEMFYINIDNVNLSSDFTNGVLAHEFQHMIHWYHDANEDTWMNEGSSELASFLNGYDPGGFDSVFIANPDLQLTSWALNPGEATPNYGAAFLFMDYFLSRFGEDATKDLVARPENGMRAVGAVLADLKAADSATGQPITAGDVFADWTVANYLGDTSVGGGRYGYANYASAPKASDTESIDSCPSDVQARTVHEFGTDYIRIKCNGKHTLTFDGSLRVGLVPTDPHGGRYMFWSNRNDDSDTTLTRAFDFTNATGPIALDYWAWHEIESDFDYAYLEVSTDGGARWTTLKTPSGTDTDPNGNNYGWGYTDVSGGGDHGEWIDERVDLSGYAGKKILLRFEYVTDDALTRPGFMLDDISIPEISYSEGFEKGDGGWEPAGWARADNNLPQAFRVQLIEFGSQTRVVPLALDKNGSATVDLDLGGGVDSVVLVVSGTTPITTELASYQFELK
ncbi:MAG: immune inhibitor A [Chloroflexi bacterium]|nr:immune inhibitor A [Chloroflexota bacterium]